MLRRDPGNPILTRADIPDLPPEIVDATSAFNPGAVATPQGVKLMLRVQTRGRETHLLMAEGEGEGPRRFRVEERRVEIPGLTELPQRLFHIYDPRITELEGAYQILFAMDMESGCYLGLARTRDFARFEFLGVVSTRDRNGVLFPSASAAASCAWTAPTRLGETGRRDLAERVRDLLAWRPVGPVAAAARAAGTS